MKSVRTKSLITLIIIIVIAALASVWAFGWNGEGILIGYHRFLPWYSNVKLGQDIKGGVTILYEADTSGSEDYEADIDEASKIIEERLSSQGYTEAVVTKQGTNRIRVEVPDVQSTDEIYSLVGRMGELEFRDSDGDVILTGENISSAYYYGYSQGEYLVSLTLDSKGTSAFAAATTSAAANNESISIYLDGELHSSPTVREAITNGQASISCASQSDAQALAVVLQSGSLPIKLTELSSTTVSATLGEQALNQALLAGLIGMILVMLFMVIMYRFMGLVADMALYVYIMIFYFFVGTFPWLQLTLPSIAGIVLSIGMAVDANIVIFERIKDEFRSGKPLASAVDSGFSKALTAIIDSNITTIIAAIVMLLPFSPPQVSNFATTLLAGVIISMFTAVVVTKGFMKLFINLGVVKPSVFGLKGVDKNEK